jgi:hypothetical protein
MFYKYNLNSSNYNQKNKFENYNIQNFFHQNPQINKKEKKENNVPLNNNKIGPRNQYKYYK